MQLYHFSPVLLSSKSGFLYFPPDEVISIVKKEIEGAGFPLPSFEPDSGYFAGKILSKEEHPLYEGTYIYALEGRGGKREAPGMAASRFALASSLSW